MLLIICADPNVSLNIDAPALLKDVELWYSGILWGRFAAPKQGPCVWRLLRRLRSLVRQLSPRSCLFFCRTFIESEFRHSRLCIQKDAGRNYSRHRRLVFSPHLPPPKNAAELHTEPRGFYWFSKPGYEDQSRTGRIFGLFQRNNGCVVPQEYVGSSSISPQTHCLLIMKLLFRVILRGYTPVYASLNPLYVGMEVNADRVESTLAISDLGFHPYWIQILFWLLLHVRGSNLRGTSKMCLLLAVVLPKVPLEY